MINRTNSDKSAPKKGIMSSLDVGSWGREGVRGRDERREGEGPA